MAKSKLEILGITPGMEQYKKMMKIEKPEKAGFKPKSFEELKTEGDARLEKGRDAVFNFKQGIKDKFVGIWGRIKGVGKEALRTAAASPEIVKYGKNLAEYKAGQAYEAVADKVENTVNASGEFVSEKYKGAVDTAKAGYNGLENRAIGAYLKVQEKFEELRREADFKELQLAQEGLFEAKSKFNDLLLKNKNRWGLDIEGLRIDI